MSEFIFGKKSIASIEDLRSAQRIDDRAIMLTYKSEDRGLGSSFLVAYKDDRVRVDFETVQECDDAFEAIALRYGRGVTEKVSEIIDQLEVRDR